jgi:hypothetical protein
VFALTATAAFAQFAGDFGAVGSQVYLDTNGADADSVGLVDLITRAIDKSRDLHIVPIMSDDALEVEAPVSMVKDPSGRRMTVTYEVTAPHGGSGRQYKTTCTSTQLDRCAAAIAQRVEQIARETKLAIPRMPTN